MYYDKSKNNADYHFGPRSDDENYDILVWRMIPQTDIKLKESTKFWTDENADEETNLEYDRSHLHIIIEPAKNTRNEPAYRPFKAVMTMRCSSGRKAAHPGVRDSVQFENSMTKEILLAEIEELKNDLEVGEDWANCTGIQLEKYLDDWKLLMSTVKRTVKYIWFKGEA